MRNCQAESCFEAFWWSLSFAACLPTGGQRQSIDFDQNLGKCYSWSHPEASRPQWHSLEPILSLFLALSLSLSVSPPLSLPLSLSLSLSACLHVILSNDPLYVSMYTTYMWTGIALHS